MSATDPEDPGLPGKSSAGIWMELQSSPDGSEILQIKDTLKVVIPVGDYLDFHIYNDPEDPEGKCLKIVITAPFPLFKDGRPDIIAKLFYDGRVKYY